MTFIMYSMMFSENTGEAINSIAISGGLTLFLTKIDWTIIIIMIIYLRNQLYSPMVLRTGLDLR